MNAQAIIQILLEDGGPLIEASVHLPRRGTRWVAAYRDETGRQTWRSTGLRDREAALVVARGWEAEAKRKRAAQPTPPRKPTIRVRPGSAEREMGLLTQAEVATILGLSVRAVREIERRAFDKIRRHPALKDFWPERKTSEIKEAGSGPVSEWALSPSEIAAVFALARTFAERQALKKLTALTQAGSQRERGWSGGLGKPQRPVGPTVSFCTNSS